MNKSNLNESLKNNLNYRTHYLTIITKKSF